MSDNKIIWSQHGIDADWNNPHQVVFESTQLRESFDYSIREDVLHIALKKGYRLVKDDRLS